MEVDLALIGHYDHLLGDVALSILKTAKQHQAHTLDLLRTIPGIGEILSLMLLYEIHDIGRFPWVQDFLSYCRLGVCLQIVSGWSTEDLRTWQFERETREAEAVADALASGDGTEDLRVDIARDGVTAPIAGRSHSSPGARD